MLLQTMDGTHSSAKIVDRVVRYIQPDTQDKPEEPEPIRIRKLDKIETTGASNPSGD